MWGLSLWCVGFCHCSRQAQAQQSQCGLRFSAACGILVPRTGIKLTAPALEGGFLTTGPSGKSLTNVFYFPLKLHLFAAISLTS